VRFNPSERRLIKKMALFRDAVERGARERAPHHVAQYALELAADFSGFYGDSPVLAAEDAGVRKTRLAITQATGVVLNNALSLLGIECPERM
jgi:arginyl-tRNA synthetase